MKHEYLFFTHVLKAGGTSIEAALRRTLGIRHMAVDPPTGWIYTAADFAFDRRLNPLARSFSSHWLRPFVSFGAFDDRITWFTMLREPLNRYRSHRQHHIERFRSRKSFQAWAADPILRNWQTRQIAGEEDVLAAKQILRERYRVVGLLERMDASLLLFRHALGLPQLPIAPRQIHNGAGSEHLRLQLEQEFEQNAESVRANNALDLELYDYAAGTLFAEQVDTYGRERLDRELTAEQRTSDAALDPLRSTAQLLYRRAIQLPISRIRRTYVVHSGRKDVRR